MATYDIILRHVRKGNVYIGGVLLLGTLDYMQIKPAKNHRPFLTANSITSCYKMIFLKHSVQSTGDAYLEVQYLVRKDYLTFDKDPHLIEIFRYLCFKSCTFLSHWNDPHIIITPFRLYRKQFQPGKLYMTIIIE